MNLFWRLLGMMPLPPKNNVRRLQYAKAFQRLVLMSTVAIFVGTAVRSIPIHAQEVHLPPDWPYTLDRVLRHLTLTWFLGFFFVSSIINDLSDTPRRLRDFFFDTFQSIIVLTAAYFLGILVPDRGFGFDDGLSAFLFSNVVVVVICLLSMLLLPVGVLAALNRLRIAGIAVGGIAATVAACATPSVVVLLLLVLLQLFLWLLLYAYFRLRLDTP